jgi:catalase
VLFDAVAILPSKDGALRPAALPATRDFIAAAVAHHKFIAYVDSAVPLLEKAGAEIDDGFVRLDKPKDCAGFVANCRKLRFWDRAAA